ncbi:TolC family protein [Crateriforma conspicua]|uniref:Outer membrane efflux protein n=1 Tax=Crateriforma conspicua TaxID=2527996 RepID=A0A5C6FRB8_9PLAN|nr:TolC family protein [Crateriforma conspicua]TWU65627.1 Outer membrane efflux protein [Crateriforma conspicua]
MNRSLFRLTAYLQIGLTVLLATGCAPTQPFFLKESPELQHYLNTATQIEYPDVEVESLAETREALPPLSINNHDYQFWDLTLEECVNMALHNAKFMITTNGIAEQRANTAEQFIAGTSDQFGSVYDVAIAQSTTQSIPLTVDGNGNRVLPRGVLRANQVGGVEDALAEFDAQATAFFDYQKGDRPNNVLPGNVFNPVFAQSDTATQQSAISKRFATGGVATLRQQILYSRNNTQPNSIARSVASDWTAIVEAQVQHPLMRNRGTLVNRIPVVLASLNEDISIAEFELQVRNLVRDVEVAYWDLYVAYRAFASVAVGRNSAQVTADFAKLNMEEGIGTIQDLKQAQGQYHSFQNQLVGTLTGSNVLGQDRFGVFGRERRLRELIGQSATDGRLIRPIDEPTIARVEHDWFVSTAQMLYLNAELRQTKFRIKQSELELMSAKNQILPEVNLSLLYRWVGVGDQLGPPERRAQNFPLPGSSALGELTEGNYQEGGVRLEITPPAFGARRELTRINGAEWRLVREKANLQEKERLLTFLLSDAITKTATHYRQIQISAAQWADAEDEVDARLANLKEGRGDTNVVLQSQQRRADAQIAYYRAVGEYNKSLNYVDYLVGTLLVNNGITVSEGPWHEKAYCDALERARERSAGYHLEYGVTRPAVVRRGPVQSADAAAQMIPGPNGGTVGSTMAPGMTMSEGEVISDTVLSGDGAFVPDLPESMAPTLSDALGDSTGDVLYGAPVDRLETVPGAQPTPETFEAPIGSGTIDRSLPAPQNGPSAEVRQMTYHWNGGGDSGVSQASPAASPAAASRSTKKVETSPAPVRRVPLPR